jgi:hypothetical protein
MALYILLHNTSGKTKIKLLENYAKNNAEHCTRQLQCIEGTVRQLYTEGYSAEADALWDTCYTYVESDQDTSNDSITSNK